MRFFFFGLLRDRDVLELVLARPVPSHAFPPARLPGFRLARMQGDTFPMLVAAPDRSVPGVVVEGLSEQDLQRIVFFESVEYRPEPVRVDLTDAGPVEARAFLGAETARITDEEWRFEDWLVRHKAKDLREAELWMSLYGVLDVAEADRLWEQARAAGRPAEDLVRELTAAPRRASS